MSDTVTLNVAGALYTVKRVNGLKNHWSTRGGATGGPSGGTAPPVGEAVPPVGEFRQFLSGMAGWA